MVNPANILLPPTHVRVGLIKQFCNVLNSTTTIAFDYIFIKFPKLSAKIKEVVLDESQIQELTKNSEYPKSMCKVEKNVWKNFLGVFKRLLRTHLESFQKSWTLQ